MEKDIRTYAQFANSLPHSFIGCLQNINIINHFLADHANAHGYRFLHDFIIEKFSPAGCQLLGIMEIKNRAALRKNHRASHYGACQWASAHLINTT